MAGISIKPRRFRHFLAVHEVSLNELSDALDSTAVCVATLGAALRGEALPPRMSRPEAIELAIVGLERHVLAAQAALERLAVA